ESILDVVAEDVEEQQVSEYVQPPAMQEHREEHREHYRLVVRRMRDASALTQSRLHGDDFDRVLELMATTDLTRDRGVVLEERLLLALLRQRRAGRFRNVLDRLEEHEHEQIDRDEQIGDPGRTTSRVLVVDRDNHV